MNILEELAEAARQRVAKAEEAYSLGDMRDMALRLPALDFAFEKTLRRPGLSFICECKKASPSKGVIAEDYPYTEIAKAYEEAGADAISVLTEPTRFLGSPHHLGAVAHTVSIPVLRKDFIVDEYQIFEARVLGASAVLLICSILTPGQLLNAITLCDSLGLSAVVEAHDEEEIAKALSASARIIGVNNRDLTDFSVDTGNSRRLRDLIPPGVLFVSESGIRTPEDVAVLREIGADAVLIGEALMRAEDKKALLASFKGAAEKKTVRPVKKAVKPLQFDDNDNVRVKLCGLTRPEDIEAANELKPDMTGFVFAGSSRRYVAPETAAELRDLLDPDIPAVGVFVDAPQEEIVSLARDGVIQGVQLHGYETPGYVRSLRRELSQLENAPLLIQAFRVRSEEDIETADKSPADLVLLDAGAGGGETFDWSLISAIHRPYLLAGGLSPDNVAEAVSALTGNGCPPLGVDVSSGIETKGRKDPAKMRAFTYAVKGELS